MQPWTNRISIPTNLFQTREQSLHAGNPSTRATFAVVFVLVFSAGVATGQNWTGNSGTNWNDPGNWNGGVPGANANVNFNNPPGSKTIDLMGTSPTLNLVQLSRVSNSAIFQNSGAAATISFNEWRITERQSTTVFNVPLSGGLFHATRKPGSQTFNAMLTLTNGTSGPNQEKWTLNGGANFTNGLDITYQAVAIGGNPTVEANSVVAFGGALNIGDRGAYLADVDGAVGNASTVVNISGGGRLQLNAAQSALPTINVGAFSALSGTVKNPGGTHLATYSATGAGNVNFVDNSVLALIAGETEPTEANLGLTPGVMDAILWKGAMGGTTTAGDDGNSVYKGIAVGQFGPSGNPWAGGETFVAPAGSGDLRIAVVTNSYDRHEGGKPQFNSPNTGVAQIEMHGTSGLTLRQGLVGSTTEFHFRNMGNTARNILTFDLTAMTAAQQIHVHDGGLSIGRQSAPDILGRLEMHGDSMIQLPTHQGAGVPLVPGTSTMVVLNDNASLSVSNVEEAVLENFTLGTDLIVNSANPAIYLESRGGDYAFGGTTVMKQLVESSNLVVAGNNNNNFELNEDIVLGDGKYFINWNDHGSKGLNVTDTSGNAGKITAVAGATTLGIANMDQAYLDIQTPIDGNGAKVVFGSADPIHAAKGTNNHLIGIPTGEVRLSAAITNTPEVAVESGRLELNQALTVPNLTINGTLDTNTNMVTVNDTLAGNGNWTNGNNGGITVGATGTYSPGESIGQIDGGALTLTSGATYDWEITDPDGLPGTTGWDFGTATDATIGSLNFNIIELNLVDEIEATDEFVVFEASGNLTFDPNNVTFSVQEDLYSWNINGASLEQVNNQLILSGITASVAAQEIPEPATIAIWCLLGIAVGGYGAIRMRRKK